MGETPFFSVVIPTFNRRELVVRAVESVLRQDESDLEVVVSDNLSTDNTGEAVQAISDPRLRYVRTDRHLVIADSCEFARRCARGRFVILLSDDDAMVKFALRRFRTGIERFDANFIFSAVAEYMDAGFPGSDRNMLTCLPFGRTSRIVEKNEFIESLYRFQYKFTFHPSAFVFERTLAERIADRTGRFFRTNGVEYYAWPLAAALARNIAFIDVPLVIMGRTSKSWGTTMELGNPGKKQIQAMVADVEQETRFVPLKNYCIVNLMAEGILTAQSQMPELLTKYVFDEERYLRSTASVLMRRIAMGVDMSAEVADLLRYAERYPELVSDLKERIRKTQPVPTMGLWNVIRKSPPYALARRLRRHYNSRSQQRTNAMRVRRGDTDSGFSISG